jgi:hypothetical protein
MNLEVEVDSRRGERSWPKLPEAGGLIQVRWTKSAFKALL